MTRVVVADDDDDILELVRFKLEQAGMDVEAVGDGVTALEACRRETPDLVPVLQRRCAVVDDQCSGRFCMATPWSPMSGRCCRTSTPLTGSNERCRNCRSRWVTTLLASASWPTRSERSTRGCGSTRPPSSSSQRERLTASSTSRAASCFARLRNSNRQVQGLLEDRIEAARAEAESVGRLLMLATGLLTVLAGGVGFAASVCVSRGIRGPLSGVRDTLDRLTDGDHDRRASRARWKWPRSPPRSICWPTRVLGFAQWRRKSCRHINV